MVRSTVFTLAVLLAVALSDEIETVETSIKDSDNYLPEWNELYETALDELPWVIDLRRELHQNPELMYDEVYTSEKISESLTELGLSHTRGWARNTKMAELEAKGLKSGEGGTGIVAEIGTGQAPCVLLRADIDALPIKEPADLLPFTSKNPGGRAPFLLLFSNLQARSIDNICSDGRCCREDACLRPRQPRCHASRCGSHSQAIRQRPWHQRNCETHLAARGGGWCRG